MNLKLGLVGKGIQHSKSKNMYEKIYGVEVDYTLFDFENPSDIFDLDTIFSKVRGLSITSPYKKHFLDKVLIDDDIRKLNAINCIKKVGSEYHATNTDYLAVEKTILDWKVQEYEIFLLGNGSMANITTQLFEKHNISFEHLTRASDGDLSSVNINKKKKTDKKTLIINACSRSFNFQGEMGENCRFWDYNYAHEIHESTLPSKCDYVDGLDLLFLQAVFATKFWNFNN